MFKYSAALYRDRFIQIASLKFSIWVAHLILPLNPVEYSSVQYISRKLTIFIALPKHVSQISAIKE